MGQRPTFIESALFTSAAQQIAAGRTRLAQVTGLNAQVNASAVPNTALDDGDTIKIVFPSGRGFSVIGGVGGGGGTGGTPAQGFGEQAFGTSTFGVGVAAIDPTPSSPSSPIVATPGVAERHIVDSLTVPLVWHKSPLQIATRSTVADIAGG